METSNQASVQNLNSFGILLASGARPAWEFHRFTLLVCIINLSNNGHFTLATLHVPFCNLTSIFKLETVYFFEFQRLDKEMNLKGKAGCWRPWQIMQIVNLSNSHASLAPEVSNNPIKIRVLNSGLIWILHHSSKNQIIEMIPEIKFATMKLLIHSWEERLTRFDCKDKSYITKYCMS